MMCGQTEQRASVIIMMMMGPLNEDAPLLLNVLKRGIVVYRQHSVASVGFFLFQMISVVVQCFHAALLHSSFC